MRPPRCARPAGLPRHHRTSTNKTDCHWPFPWEHSQTHALDTGIGLVLGLPAPALRSVIWLLDAFSCNKYNASLYRILQFAPDCVFVLHFFSHNHPFHPYSASMYGHFYHKSSTHRDNVWGSVSCPRTLWHAYWRSQVIQLPTLCLVYNWSYSRHTGGSVARKLQRGKWHYAVDSQSSTDKALPPPLEWAGKRTVLLTFEYIVHLSFEIKKNIQSDKWEEFHQVSLN